MTLALFALMTLCQPVSSVHQGPQPAPAPLQSLQSDTASTTLATFYPVCRDGRGAWDRRACRHLRRTDPARLLLV